jgi:hypothetical protein
MRPRPHRRDNSTPDILEHNSAPHSAHGVVELLHRLDLLWDRTNALS